MKALTLGHYRGLDGIWAVFDLEYGTELRVGIIEQDIGRVVLRRNGAWQLDRSWSIAPDRAEPGFEGRLRDDVSGFACPDITVETKRNLVILKAGAISAWVTLSPFGIEWFRGEEDEPFLQDRATQAYFISRQSGAVSHYMARSKHERHYGLGDKTGPLDRTGRRFRVDAVDPCGFDGDLSDPLYKMIPFLIVSGETGSHGLFYDNMAVAEMDLGATLDNYHGLFRSYSAQRGDLDYYVFAGPDVPGIVRRFSWLTGGQAFLPKWTLGFAMTSMAIADAADADAQISGFIEKCRQHDIVCDSFHFGSGYTMIGNRRYAFHWNRSKFADPPATLKRLNDAGMHPVTNLKPCLLDDHPRLGELQKEGGLVLDGETGNPSLAQFWDGPGYHLDFTHPEGRQWWQKGLRAALLDQGVLAIWNDNNEYEIWDEDAMCHGDGRPFALSLARPGQALLMTKLAYETQTAHALGKRPYTITRGGCAGLARYGQTWSGDNETAWKTLRTNLVQGLNMSLSGLFNIGHDVGGFHGPRPDAELLCRFVEFCALWPRFVMNSWNDDDITTTPWMHEEVLPAIRATMQLRTRLLPLLYTLLWRASLMGEPVVRPLFYDFPHDQAAARTENAFMLGHDILVAPVLEQGATQRMVNLPEHRGGWYDFHDHRHYDGGEPIEVTAPLGRLPVFVRSGAMIPQGSLVGGMDPSRDTQRTIVVFGAPDQSETVLYEDDGDTDGWRNGTGLVISLKLVREGASLVISASADGKYRPAYPNLQLRSATGHNLRIAKMEGIVLSIIS